MWKNPHVFKHAAQYGLRTRFASDVRMVRAMVTFLILKCEHVCQGNSSAQRVPEEREDFQDQCFIFLVAILAFDRLVRKPSVYRTQTMCKSHMWEVQRSGGRCH